MSDHPTAKSVKVSIGAKDPQKPSRKPFTFGLPNEMRLIDIYKHIRNPPAEDHIDAIKELREFVDQHQGTINELKLRQDSLPPDGTLNPTDQKELDKYWSVPTVPTVPTSFSKNIWKYRTRDIQGHIYG